MHNIYKEFCELSHADAIKVLYQDMAARHHAHFQLIHICVGHHEVHMGWCGWWHRFYGSLSLKKGTMFAIPTSNSSSFPNSSSPFCIALERQSQPLLCTIPACSDDKLVRLLTWLLAFVVKGAWCWFPWIMMGIHLEWKTSHCQHSAQVLYLSHFQWAIGWGESRAKGGWDIESPVERYLLWFGSLQFWVYLSMHGRHVPTHPERPLPVQVWRQDMGVSFSGLKLREWGAHLLCHTTLWARLGHVSTGFWK